MCVFDTMLNKSIKCLLTNKLEHNTKVCVYQSTCRINKMPYKDNASRNVNERMKYHQNKAERNAYARMKYHQNRKKELARGKKYYQNHKQQLYASQRRLIEQKRAAGIKIKPRGLCVHSKQKHQCKQCSPIQYQLNLIRNRMNYFFRYISKAKKCRTKQALGCEPEFFHAYIHEKMDHWNNTHQEKMTYQNVSIDHIKPGSLAQTEEDVIDLSHYTNMQPLIKRHNISKSNHWSEEDEIYWRNNIYQNANYRGIYWPQACNAMTESNQTCEVST